MDMSSRSFPGSVTAETILIGKHWTEEPFELRLKP